MLKPPIIIDARSQLLIFYSLASAEAYLQPEDVRNHLYHAAYDSEGRLLRPEIHVREHRFLGMVRQRTECTQIVECEHVPAHDLQLRDLLRRFITPRDGPFAGAPGNPIAGFIHSAVRKAVTP